MKEIYRLFKQKWAESFEKFIRERVYGVMVDIDSALLSFFRDDNITIRLTKVELTFAWFDGQEMVRKLFWREDRTMPHSINYIDFTDSDGVYLSGPNANGKKCQG